MSSNDPTAATSQPDDNDIIRSAERLVAELWKTARAEPVQDAPACSEALEDEVFQLGRCVEAWVTEHDAKATGVEFATVLRQSHSDMVVYVVEVVRHFLCGSCDKIHDELRNIVIIKDGSGVMEVLNPDVIFDRSEELAKRHQGGHGNNPTAISLIDLVRGMASKDVEKLLKKVGDLVGKDAADIAKSLTQDSAAALQSAESAEPPVESEPAAAAGDDEGDEALLAAIKTSIIERPRTIVEPPPPPVVQGLPTMDVDALHIVHLHEDVGMLARVRSWLRAQRWNRWINE